MCRPVDWGWLGFTQVRLGVIRFRRAREGSFAPKSRRVHSGSGRFTH